MKNETSIEKALNIAINKRDVSYLKRRLDNEKRLYRLGKSAVNM